MGVLNRIGCFWMFLQIVSLSLFAQKQNGYEITGHMEGLKEGEKVTMLLSYSKGEIGEFFKRFQIRDSSYVKNGEFHLSGIVPEGPRQYYMEFDKHTGIGTGYRGIRLYIDNGEHIVIHSSNIDSIPHGMIEHYINIEGSPTNYSMMCLAPFSALYNESLYRINKQMERIKDSIGFDGSILEGLIEAKKNIHQSLFYNVFYDGKQDPEVKPANLCLLTNFGSSEHASYWMNVYKGLNEKRKNSFYGKWLKDISILTVGQPFPPFVLPTPEGKPLALKDVVSKSKITIVHFWADKSVDRAKYQDELMGFYKKYHDQGLNIIAISSDIYADQWKDAIRRYKLSSWYNVSDLKGHEGIVEKVYKEFGSVELEIPNTTNVLIDNQGEIIAWDVSGVQLQWYLWKYLDNKNINFTNEKLTSK